MKWTYSRYRLWVINTNSEARLYEWDNWKQLFPCIDRLVKITAEPAYIRTFQTYESEGKQLPFGRMKWDEGNNEKWTTKFRNVNAALDVRFFYTEIWAPDWKQVGDSGIPPDIYVRLYNNPNKDLIKEGLIIAIRRPLAKKHSAVVESELEKLNALIPNSKLKMTTRFWSPGWSFLNHIPDMNEWELAKFMKDA